MTAYVVSITQSQVYAALVSFISSALGLASGFVIQGYQNRAPMPNGPFVAVSIISMKRLRTNVDNIAAASGGDPSSITIEQGTQADIQIDCYGGGVAGDWANILTALLRDNVGCLALAPTCQPLYADDPVRMPIENAESEYEDRWTVTARIQYNPVITQPVQSATALEVNLIDVTPTGFAPAV